MRYVLSASKVDCVIQVQFPFFICVAGSAVSAVSAVSVYSYRMYSIIGRLRERFGFDDDERVARGVESGEWRVESGDEKNNNMWNIIHIGWLVYCLALRHATSLA